MVSSSGLSGNKPSDAKLRENKPTDAKTRPVKLAIVQMQITNVLQENVQKAAAMITKAAAQGANIILLPELFENLYFPQQELEENFLLAHAVEGHPFLDAFQRLAKEHQVVLPISFFEKENHCYFNSLAMIDADGQVLGIYRKSHIPDGPGYEEKYYFSPGNTGFKVWKTKFGNLGVGICWDQWYPECARSMALQGADLLLYPTAIGSEPAEANGLQTKDMWQRAMIGHAVCNAMPVAAANRIGIEGQCDFYGASFICDARGEKQVEGSHTFEGILECDLNFAADRTFRAGMGFFRDRRPEHYSALTKP